MWVSIVTLICELLPSHSIAQAKVSRYAGILDVFMHEGVSAAFAGPEFR